MAFGAGLVIAGLIPASKAEAQGAQRLKDAAQEHGQPVMDQAKSAAQEVGEQLKDKATEAAQEVKASAQESTDRVKEEAPTGSPSNGDEPAHRSPGAPSSSTKRRLAVPGVDRGRQRPAGLSRRGASESGCSPRAQTTDRSVPCGVSQVDRWSRTARTRRW